jgi:hypothetical protein
MIYVLAGNQLATLVTFVFVVAWMLENKKLNEELQTTTRFQSEERLQHHMEKQATDMKALFETMSEKAFIEREQLLNRLTHPDIAASQVPSAVTGDVGIEDDEELKTPTEPEEDKPAEDRIPMKDLLVRPREPVGPMGSMTFEDDEEEE